MGEGMYVFVMTAIRRWKELAKAIQDTLFTIYRFLYSNTKTIYAEVVTLSKFNIYGIQYYKL